MLARDEVEAYYFGRYDKRLALLDLLNRYLDDPRLAPEILGEIIAKILKQLTGRASVPPAKQQRMAYGIKTSLLEFRSLGVKTAY